MMEDGPRLGKCTVRRMCLRIPGIIVFSKGQNEESLGSVAE